MTHYLIVNKSNEVITSFTDKDVAENYVKARPYLKISEFDDSPGATDVPHHTATDVPHHTATDDLPF